MKDFEADFKSGFSRYIGPDDDDVYSDYFRATKAELGLEAYDERDEDYVLWTAPFINTAILDIEYRYRIKEYIRFGLSSSFYPSGKPRINSSPRCIFSNNKYYIFIPGDLVVCLCRAISMMDFSQFAVAIGMPTGDYTGNNPSSSITADSLFSVLMGRVGHSNIVNILTQLCLSFWVYHEMVHIKNAHLSLMAKSRGLEWADKRIVNRVLEFDADVISVSFLLQRIHRQFGLPFSILRYSGPVDPIIIDSESDIINLAAMVITICFAVSPRRSLPEHPWAGTHPPSGFRLFSAYRQIFSVSTDNRWMGDDINKISESIAEAFRISGETTRQFSNNGGGGTFDFGIEDAYQHEIGIMWNSVRGFLDINCLGGSVAPEFIPSFQEDDPILAHARAFEWWPDVQSAASRVAGYVRQVT